MAVRALPIEKLTLPSGPSIVSPEVSSFVREARLAFDYSLANFVWKQAVFFAERLVAACPSDETNYLLALAYFHKQEISRAQWHLKGSKLPEARYLLAKCCYALQKWDEAEEALFLGPPGSQPEVVNGAAGLLLLGQVREKQSKREQAIDCYVKCLELCPFMWEAYERWSWLILGTPSPSRSSNGSFAASTFSDDKMAQSFSAISSFGTQSQASAQCSTGASTPLSALSPLGPHVRLTPDRASPVAANGGTARSQNAPPRNEREQQHHQQARKDRRAENTRSGGGGSQNTNGSHQGSVREVVSARKSSNVDARQPCLPNDEVTLASLMTQLGSAVHAMHSFDTQQAAQMLGKLPKRHYESGYVQELVGLCHFESADYKKAELAFQQVLRIEPRRLEGLEYYSSVLWHLRKEKELGRLAQQCLQWDRMKPEVWCVVGNCFSLQKEHDVAIKFFKRAIQVDPSFVYAYTLCGHEYMANEKFDKAVPMYQHALDVDPRHYNAWWGLGNIYHRQEDHVTARYHFMRALEINRHNSVLRCYLGMVMEALNNPSLALEYFDKACQGEPQNSMAFFQKARVLIALDRYEEALDALRKVHVIAPKEACVHFQLGKVYMKLQYDRKALHHFNAAMDLNRDSKDYHTIKMHIERLHLRGITQPDAEDVFRGHEFNPASNVSDDREPFDVGSRDRLDSNAQFYAGATSCASPTMATPQVQSQRPGSAYAQPAYGTPALPRAADSSPNNSGMAAPQTPSAVQRGACGGSTGRNLWSQRGPGPGIVHAGRGASPTSWGGAPGFRI
mmetsp:Transcript_22800/g.53243  ORF Transcript_22800/g.53243 Transcript_22800/m.53243 type:complete len:792 (+) Transcript_22800:53-2428(+)